MTPRSPLVLDLKRLRRGRGVRRPKPETWIGPELRAMLQDIHGSAAGEDLRQQLVDLVRTGCAGLSPNQLRLYQAAVGATQLEGLLTDRLAVVSTTLRRDQRTLQRWLDRADLLVAERLEQNVALRQAEAEVVRRGWTLERFSGEVRLDLPRPRWVTTRTIQVIGPELSQITDLFSVAESPNGPVEIDIEVTAGGRLRRVERVSETLWRSHIDLPTELHRGDRWDLTLRATLPDQTSAANHALMAPVRPCESFAVRVAVGDSGADQFQAIDGLPIAVLEDPSLAVRPVPIVDGAVTYSAQQLTAGLAYGLRWSWGTQSS